jgi:hypothetical protein
MDQPSEGTIRSVLVRKLGWAGFAVPPASFAGYVVMGLVTLFPRTGIGEWLGVFVAVVGLVVFVGALAWGLMTFILMSTLAPLLVRVGRYRLAGFGLLSGLAGAGTAVVVLYSILND